MSKRLIYLVLFALLGAFVMFQSCSDTPVFNEQSAEYQTDGAGNGIKDPNTYCGSGTVLVRNDSLPLTINTLQLWAGVGNPASAILVGNVTFNVHGATMDVVYNLNLPVMFPYVPTALHFDIRTDLKDIPQTKNGNPIPGQFQYSINVEPPYSNPFVIPNVPIPSGTGPFYAAAHASIFILGGVPGFNYYLPNNTVSLVVQQLPYSGGPSYWKYRIDNAGFISTYDSDGPGPLLPGEYLGWCIDIDHTMGTTTYPAQLFSSYENLPSWLIGEGLIEYPENLDKVNYLVNHFKTGDMIQPVSACGVPVGLTAALTYSDIQVAVWTLLENSTAYSGLSTWDPNRVRAILCDVNANGEGFVPACDQRIVFIVVPNTGNKVSVQLVIGQPIIGDIQVPCVNEGNQTAWADGRWGANFDGKNWATYFKYKPSCTP